MDNRIAAQEALEEFREDLTRSLGLPRPVSDEALAAAVENPLYVHHLRICSESPALLEWLLAHPEPSPAGRRAEEVLEPDALDLAARVGKALWNWRRTGFQKVDDATYERRWRSCLICPHFKEAPVRWPYKLAQPSGSDSRICGLCGCVASRKAWIPTEACPDRHPLDGTLSRWGEPLTTV